MIAAHEVSRRLKAARWLAGDVGPDGKPRALSVAELAQRDELVNNRISANRLEEIEQIKTQARPVELREIARALEVPEQWFDEDYVIGTSLAPPMVAKLFAQVLGRLEAIEDGLSELRGEDSPPPPPAELLERPSEPETGGRAGRRVETANSRSA